MRQLGKEKTQVGGLVRQTWRFSAPAHLGSPSSGATLLVVFLAALMTVSLLLAVFARLLLNHYEAQVPATPPSRIAALNQEAELLQKKVVGLVSGSIEMKLQAIESSIQQGRVTATDLQALEELRQELRILASYSVNAQSLLDDPVQIRGGMPTLSPSRSDGVGGDELSFVRNLFYFSLASVSVAGLLAGGYWLHVHRRRRLPPPIINPRPMITRRR